MVEDWNADKVGKHDPAEDPFMVIIYLRNKNASDLILKYVFLLIESVFRLAGFNQRVRNNSSREQFSTCSYLSVFLSDGKSVKMLRCA